MTRGWLGVVIQKITPGAGGPPRARGARTERPGLARHAGRPRRRRGHRAATTSSSQFDGKSRSTRCTTCRGHRRRHPGRDQSVAGGGAARRQAQDAATRGSARWTSRSRTPSWRPRRSEHGRRPVLRACASRTSHRIWPCPPGRGGEARRAGDQRGIQPGSPAADAGPAARRRDPRGGQAGGAGRGVQLDETAWPTPTTAPSSSSAAATPPSSSPSRTPSLDLGDVLGARLFALARACGARSRAGKGRAARFPGGREASSRNVPPVKGCRVGARA